MANWTQINKQGVEISQRVSSQEESKCKKGLLKKKRVLYKICLLMAGIKTNKYMINYYTKASKSCDKPLCVNNCKELIALNKHEIELNQRDIQKLRRQIKMESTQTILTENYLDFLNRDQRALAKEWRGPNIPYGDDSNRPNLIRQCTMLESSKMKINCLRKLRDQAAMNPFYQYRIDRYIDEITDTYEPTDKPGTIPGNEFKTSGVGGDFNSEVQIEGVIQKTKDHIKHSPNIVETISRVKFLALDMGYVKGFNLKFCQDVPSGKERKQCELKNRIVKLQGEIKALGDFAAGRGKAGARFSGGCSRMDPSEKAVCHRIVGWKIKEIQRELKPLLRKYRGK